VVDAEGLAPAGAALFERLDLHGLEIDARMRRRYLMAALCRTHPIASAAIGSTPAAARRLAAFLGSRALFRPPGERTRAFGSFLGGLLEENAFGAPPEAVKLLRPFLDLEVARAGAAAALRRTVEAGGGAPRPRARPPTGGELKRGCVELPPFFVAAELPVATPVLAAALHRPSPENAWSLVESGALAFERIVSVARGDPHPVTVLSRAIAAGTTIERAGAGGVSPFVDVTHLQAELAGRRGPLLALFDGTRRLAQLPPRDREIARGLLDAGLLELVPAQPA
jgi:hypothetical protein